MNVFQRWIAPLLAMLLMAASVWAQTAPYSSTPIQAVPPNIAARDFPAMMMLAASRDHTLFGPMYTDYEDLTGRGRIDPTYRPDFSYYGYFDPSKCYSHDGNKFVPEAFRDASTWCQTKGSARWSGNFLNWATMTRIDVVRKMLYGGYRQEDTATSTVLQLAQLGNDAHAFAKYYRGSDIALYTPFTTGDLTNKDGTYVGLTTCAMSTASDAVSGVPILRLVKGNYLLWSTTAKKVCRWRPSKDTANAANADYWFGAKLVQYFKRDAALAGSDLRGMPDHADIAPFNDVDDLPKGLASNDLPIRVLACVSVDLMGQENCKRFEYHDSSGSMRTSLKPSGILLDYGFASSATDSARAEFGLVSGSYDNNLSGGVLRKNIGNLNDEVNLDGTFCHKSSTPCSGGIIKSFDVFSLYDAGAKYYAEGAYSWVMPESLVNKQFPSWGNPIGEMLIEALSYYAHQGKSAYSGAAAVTIDTALGLPKPDWQDPLDDSSTVPGAGSLTRGQVYGKSVCRPLNMLAISSSAVSYDRDDIAQFDKLPNLGGDTLASFTDTVGDREGITGSTRAVANVAGGWGKDCSGKVVTHLWQVSGICPEAPATKGSYLSAGAALYGNTRAIRGTTGSSIDIPGFASKSLPSDLPGYALRVKTLAAAMGGGVARIEVVDPDTGAKVYITPSSIWDLKGRTVTASGDTWMPGAMLTIKLLNSMSNAAGKTIAASYVVTWNDAQFGGDYDMDIVGYISYAITGGVLKVTTDILNVDGGLPGSHGFSITGAVDDAGNYITHGSHSIAYGDCNPTTTTLSKRDYNLRCRYDDAGMPTAATGGSFDNWAWPTQYDGSTVDFSSGTSSTRTFTFNTSKAGSVLNDPLWYAAKYGSFTTGEEKFAATYAGTLPDAASAAEGYFLARDPAKLEAGLRKALDKILATGNSTPAVSTAQLISTSLKYVAEFDAKAHTGMVKAYEFSGTGFKKEPKFELGDKLTEASRPTAEHATGVRQVITNVGLVGWPLQVASLEPTSPSALGDVRTALNADAGTDSWKDLVAYARGGIATGDLRKQPTNVLGPIVNGAPWLQRGALLRTTDVDLPSGWASYREFAMTRSSGSYPPLLWVASDDSMLHAFHATTGEPWMSYLPSPLMGGLRAASREPTKAITATMDGSPFTADVHLPDSGAGSWATYLFSSLGRGGRAVFALDVTNTSASGPLKKAELNASSIFKWMFSSDDDNDLGYVLIDPVIHRSSGQPANVVRLNNGRFAVMVPNGYGSTNERGVLFFLDVSGPQDSGAYKGTWKGGRAKKLFTNSADTGNGLMGATWVDIDNNGTADWVYATDLKGNVWKFDITSSNPDDWGSAYKSGDVAVPLFQARSVLPDGTAVPLPITTAPVITFPGMGGVMVGFGTGKSIVAGDFPNTKLPQRFYTIWDRGNFVVSSSSAGSVVPMTTLLGRQLVRDAATGDVTLTGSGATSMIDWTTQNGWYLDFPVTAGQTSGSGDMVLSTPVVRSGVLFFTTVWPNGSEDLCQTAPFSTLYALSPTQGLAVHGLLPTAAAAGVTVTDSKVLVVSDQTVTPETGKDALRIEGRNWELPLSPSSSSGRVQWRVIPGLKTYP